MIVREEHRFELEVWCDNAPKGTCKKKRRREYTTTFVGPTEDRAYRNAGHEGWYFTSAGVVLCPACNRHRSKELARRT